MSRYIDADAIDTRYVPIAPVIDGYDVHYEWVAFVEDINEQPTVDAEPVRHGKWEMKPDLFGFFNEIPVCSECGCTTAMRDKPLYCPYCGARMDKE